MVDRLLKRELDKLGTPEQAAARLNVSTAYIYMLKQGVRRPSDNLLETLGLKRVDKLVRANGS